VLQTHYILTYPPYVEILKVNPWLQIQLEVLAATEELGGQELGIQI